MPRIRLYQSALNDVKYVFGSPVRFEPDQKLCELRQKGKQRMIDQSSTVYDS